MQRKHTAFRALCFKQDSVTDYYKKIATMALVVIGTMPLLMLSSCAETRSSGTTHLHPTPIAPQDQTKSIPLAPWDTWTGDTQGVPEFEEADAFSRAGNPAQALVIYTKLQQNPNEPLPPAKGKGAPVVQQVPIAGNSLGEEAFLRRLGTLLKLGKSKDVLELAGRYLASRGGDPSNLSSRLSLVVAFAYLHQAQFDQTLAWMGVVRKNAQSPQLELFARQEIKRLIESLPQRSFDTYAERWAEDDVIGVMFSQDRLRRSQGGQAKVNYPPDLFSSETYVAANSNELRNDQAVTVEDLSTGAGWTEEQVGLVNPSEIVIGLLLPFNSKYAEHSQRIKDGVELALAQLGALGELSNGMKVRLAVGDSQGDAESAGYEYRRLVEVEHATIVLGPLLVKDTEKVAEESRNLRIPFVTFTKQGFIPELGVTAFRLGATVENQTAELAAYSVQQLRLQRFGVLYPNNPAGTEFLNSFKQSVGEVVAAAPYNSAEPASLQPAVNQVLAVSPDGVLIPDTLEAAVAVIEQLQAGGFKGVIMGPALWDDRVVQRGYGKLLDGAVYVTPFFPLSKRPLTTTFVQNYRQRFGKDPELLAAQAYDAARLVLVAVEGALSTSAERGAKAGFYPLFIKNLNSADNFEGVTGRISSHGNGELGRKMSVLRLHDGEAIEVMFGGELTGFVPDQEERPSSETNREISGKSTETKDGEESGEEAHLKGKQG